MARLADDITVAVFLDAAGYFCAGRVIGTGPWELPRRFGGGVGSPGGFVTLAKQTEDILVAVFVGADGFLYVVHAEGDAPFGDPFARRRSPPHGVCGA
jgi:hypothetical protein